MQFLADVELICEECKGTRYKNRFWSPLQRQEHPRSIELTIREALKFFADVPKLAEKLRVLDEVGLGYLRLGQSATTLSGGEAQRMKLASHLQPRAKASAGPRVKPLGASAARCTSSTSPLPACISTMSANYFPPFDV